MTPDQIVAQLARLPERERMREIRRLRRTQGIALLLQILCAAIDATAPQQTDRGAA